MGVLEGMIRVKRSAIALVKMVLISTVLCVLAAGCSTPGAEADQPKVESQPGGLKYLTEGSAVDEYHAAIRDIGEPLPEGQHYPPGLPEHFLPVDGYLEEGAARNQAWFTWLCAWETEYLQAFASDSSTQAHAEMMIERWATMDFYLNVIVDPERGWVSNVVAPMQLGDPTGVRADHRQLCGQFPTVSSEK